MGPTHYNFFFLPPSRHALRCSAACRLGHRRPPPLSRLAQAPGRAGCRPSHALLTPPRAAPPAVWPSTPEFGHQEPAILHKKEPEEEQRHQGPPRHRTPPPWRHRPDQEPEEGASAAAPALVCRRSPRDGGRQEPRRQARVRGRPA
jgi:hypothetical protein